MNFFDFATLAKKKGNVLLNNTVDFNGVSLHQNETPCIQTLKRSSNSSKNCQKAFDLVKSMNEELDHMLEEAEQNSEEIDRIISEYLQLNQKMEILFGEVISDLKKQSQP